MFSKIVVLYEIYIVKNYSDRILLARLCISVQRVCPFYLTCFRVSGPLFTMIRAHRQYTLYKDKNYFPFIVKFSFIFKIFFTGAWGMDFVSSSPLFSTTPLFSKFSYKSFLFQNFHNHSFFLHLTISVDVIHHE